MKNFSKHIIKHTFSIKQALEKLNSFNSKDDLTLFVIDENERMIGTITDGDIRRGLLNSKNLESSVVEIMFPEFRFLEKSNINLDKIQYFRNLEIHLVPVLDENKRIVKILNLSENQSILPIDAVLMAGGKGERLKPLTDTTPKPLLKVGQKPIIEYNLDRLEHFGVENVWISVRYLAEQIIEYLGDGSNKNLNIQYIKEEKPLGTAGAVSLIENFKHETVLLMNSDLLTNIDFEDFYKTFMDSEASMCIATIPYKVSIPYAILETEHHEVLDIKEKPSYIYQANAGIYLIKRKYLNLIPQNSFFDAPDLVQELIRQGKKISYYSILGYWLDIGKPEDFTKAQEDVNHIKF
ncbi:MAG: nucleotidyltransferase family protein [Raineya sp.]|jgi:dTDP-glucose pyrophosphorylase|nr:nucleotidyltransferase family protein [Raineya sp.]